MAAVRTSPRSLVTLDTKLKRPSTLLPVSLASSSKLLPVSLHRESGCDDSGEAASDGAVYEYTARAPARLATADDQNALNSKGWRYLWPYTKRPAGRCDSVMIPSP